MSPLTEKSWQQTKSENTRHKILDAEIQCFFERGYAATTTDIIVSQAGVSQGAMLHHFPSRRELIQAAVRHLGRRRIELFDETESQIKEGTQHSPVVEGIDAHWEQLQSLLFIVFHELQVACRTDAVLQDVMAPAMSEFEASWQNMLTRVFPDLALSEAFETATLLTTFLLEGMAVSRTLPASSRLKVVGWRKQELRRMFKDVEATDRHSARLTAKGFAIEKKNLTAKALCRPLNNHEHRMVINGVRGCSSA
jgi:AcrR family transcriptional regulator